MDNNDIDDDIQIRKNRGSENIHNIISDINDISCLLNMAV